jgi:uncharacterized protein (DUF1800 family)
MAIMSSAVLLRRASRWLLLLAAAIAAPLAAAQDLIFANGFDTAPEGPFNREEASRFLTQATFGPKLGEIDRLLTLGYSAWFAEQAAAPISRQLPFLDQLIAQVPPGQPIEIWQDRRQEIWWRNTLNNSDQLRQRVAFALSQLLVVSDQNGAVEGNPTTLAHYHDLLSSNAFGNYRILLEQVTLHPTMGHYLSMIRNRKPDTTLNIRPDENFAREIMQLFSVGLVMLNADGSVRDGNPGVAGIQSIPTYDQNTIRGFAQVFTGWNYATCVPPNNSSADPNNNLNWWNWEYCESRAPDAPANQDWRSHRGWREPLQPWGEGNGVRGEVYYAHEGSKQLLNYTGVVLPAGVLPSSSGRAAGNRARYDLGVALDNVFNHPNLGPFVARHLIQRLVSSNPSPAYVGRVAAVFADDNGAASGGVRGNLQAVVRAVLMDVEARNLAQAAANSGKLREPLLRVTQLWRALDARSRDGVLREGWPEYYSAQAVLRSPTVFNFYLPNYRLPGEIANLGLYSPEFQITTDTYITRLSNEIGGKVYWAWFGNTGLGSWDPVQVDLTRDLALVETPAALIDRYNLLFLGGRMSTPMRNLLLTHLNSIAPNSWEGWRRERVQDALWLILTSPEYVVER